MRCSITAPRLPNPPRRTTQAMGADGCSGTEVHGPEGDRRPSPAGREGETLQPPRILVNALQHRASLFSEPKHLLPTSVAVAALAGDLHNQPLDDLVDAGAAGVDDAVALIASQRCLGAARVAAVAFVDLAADVFERQRTPGGLKLFPPPFGAHCGRGVEEVAVGSF